MKWDLETIPIEIMSDSSVGSGDKISLIMFGKDPDGREGDTKLLGIVKILYNDTFHYRIGSCNLGQDQEFQVPPSRITGNATRIWRIVKSITGIKISCNGTNLLDMVFADVKETCNTTWGGDVISEFSFNGNNKNNIDQASRNFRARVVPRGECMVYKGHKI